ncbi:MAG: hypothetical protein KF767_10405 [Bdellovibrionaceae bacterium]|nr:hypothetical protein [Pseudobdellovibrionaceae bacterium]
MKEFVEFEVVAPTADEAVARRGNPEAGSPRSGSRARGLSPKTSPQVSLEDLIPKYDPSKVREPLLGRRPRIDQEYGAGTATLRREGPLGDAGYDAHGTAGVYGYSEGMDLPKSTETMPFFQALWRRVDDVMDFPVEIAQMRIGGQVVVHLNVNAQGEMVGDFLRIESDHPVLLTYALVVLSQSLKTPLPERVHLPPGHADVPVALTFDFRVVTMHGLYPRRGGYFKNSLEFSRTRYMDPYALEAIDYVLTNYVPPIIPFPGGVYVDFVRAYQMIDNYANDRPDLYDQHERQYHLLREKLDLAIVRDEAAKARLEATAKLTAPTGSALPRKPLLTR